MFPEWVRLQDWLEDLPVELRPNHRWLSVGCSRSGMYWHQDPLGTAAIHLHQDWAHPLHICTKSH